MEPNAYDVGTYWTINSNDEWNGLIGYVTDVSDDGSMIALCVVIKPGQRYFVTIEEADKILTAM